MHLPIARHTDEDGVDVVRNGEERKGGEMFFWNYCRLIMAFSC